MEFEQCALGVQIPPDRQFTSVIAVGDLPDGLVGVDLAAHLDGADTAAAVAAIVAERHAFTVALDPHSPAATLLHGLELAAVSVTQLTAVDLAVAHGLFLDELKAGRLRHGGQPELTAAARAAQERLRLSGAAVPVRTGVVAPFDAAEFAVWAWLHAPRPPDPWVMSL